ncbi:MAG: hypothetical protein UY01_C0006G0035 [Candidatus Nomurabacteria bacterium GW2011_GWB1_47_6]|uniref:Uncharacterized protein n=1 Tax=Candidatus Nomurabacteria bacterium GW2011_GWB1_47_6 TaxID=1618749 RepID=A0A0G1T1K9_9BACT|nr:MAG: hypothetical protein UY01_C0006G0035 [Candidatus Nomurabacteria bacterium GW2011_GWB1_47_6]
MNNAEKNFRKFRKGPILLAVGFLAASCFGFFYVFKAINENKAVASEALLAWKAEETKRDEVRSLDKFLESVRDDRASLDGHFAQSSNAVPFLDSLEELGGLASAKSEVLSVEMPVGGSDLLVTLKAEGSFKSVYKFLELLENSPYALEFVSLDIGRVSKTDAAAGWEGFFKIKLLTFTP